MSATQRRLAVILVVTALVGSWGTPRAGAQMAMSRGGRSLGGYGANAGILSGASTTAYLPYAGGGHGFLPYSGGRGSAIGVQPIPRRVATTPIAGTMMPETPIGGASLTTMQGARHGMSARLSQSRQPLIPFGYEPGAMPTSMAGRMSARRPYGPGFGAPFRTLPPLAGANTGGMAMP